MATDRPPPGEPAVPPSGLPPQPPRPVRYVGFVVTGLVVGLVAAVLVWAFGSGDARYSQAGALGYLAAVGGLVGAILGGAVGVAVETVATRRYRRRATRGR